MTVPQPWYLNNVDQPVLESQHGSVEVAAGAQAVNRSSVASLAFLVWDILITTDDEIRYVWPSAWSYTKCVYCFVRYFPAAVQISILLVGTELTPYFHFDNHDCYIWQVYQGVASTVIILIVDTILILRIHALYHNHSTIRRVVGSLFFLEIVGLVVGLSLTLPGVKYDSLCSVVDMPGSIIIYGASSLIFQSALFSLTLYKFIQAARLGWRNVPLMILLLRDGTWAFLLLFVIYVGQISMAGLPREKHSYLGVLYGWSLTAFSFSGYRILLNLKCLAEEIDYCDSGPHDVSKISGNMRFAAHPSTSAMDSSETRIIRTTT